VINGLTDLSHPCQVLADLFTVQESLGGWEGKTIAWVGDGNNMANSWLEAAAVLGFDLRLACPEGFEPDRGRFERAQKAASVLVTEVPEEAVEGAHVVNTDVWASMGQEAEAAERKKIFKDYRIDANTMKIADKNCVILHCLPAHYGDEIDYATSRLSNSAIFDQAENRMHAQNALMVHLICG